MDSIEVSDSLTIGGAKPLGQDAIDKLQAQIIAPNQYLYVDQKNGNDNNTGNNWDNALQSIDKALTLIKLYTDTVVINLRTYTNESDLIYNTYHVSAPIDITNKYHVDTFVFEGYWQPYQSNDINAKIIVPYGKKSTGIYDYSTGQPKQKFMWGNILFSSGVNVQLNQVVPVFPEDIETNATNFVNTVFSGITKSARIYEGRGNTVNIPSSNTHILHCFIGDSFDSLYFYFQNITGNGLLTKQGYPTLFIDDPKTSQTKEIQNIVSNTIARASDTIFVINKIIGSGSTFGDTVLGSTKGVDANIEVIYSNL